MLNCCTRRSSHERFARLIATWWGVDQGMKIASLFVKCTGVCSSQENLLQSVSQLNDSSLTQIGQVVLVKCVMKYTVPAGIAGGWSALSLANRGIEIVSGWFEVPY